MLFRAALLFSLLMAWPSYAATPPVATPVAGNSVVIDHSGYISSINIVTGATAGYIVVVDSATLPGDGTIKPIMCSPVAVTTGLVLNFRSDPVMVGTGAAVLFSSGASCFALVKSATAFISVEMR